MAEGLIAVKLNGKSLVKELIDERYRQRITQGEMSARMGVARPTLVRFETECMRRRSPSLDIVTRYAEALGVEIGFELKPKENP